jgi:Protein of unknown function (DUF5818)
MKKSHHLGEAVALVLAAALCAFTPGLLAQTQPNTPQQEPQQQQAQPQNKTYAGKIMKLQDGRYALVTGQNPQGQLSGHFLDDQTDAKKYEGKQVRVTGTLDMASNTIHVTRIVAA